MAAGFFGKLFLLTSGFNSGVWVLLGFAAINLVISLYNYLRVIKIMFIDKAEQEIAPVEKNKALTTALIICAIGLVITGFVTSLYPYIESLN